MGKGGNAWLWVSVLVMVLLLRESKVASVGLSTHLAPQVRPTLTPPPVQPDATRTMRATDGYGAPLFNSHSGGSCPMSGTLLLVSARAAECSDYSEWVSHEFPFKRTILGNWQAYPIRHVYPQHTLAHLDQIAWERFKTLMPQAEGWGLRQL